MATNSNQHDHNYDFSFKILLIGDSGVGKSSLILSFLSESDDNLAPNIAGQERYRTLTGSNFRGAQGIIFVYDVTRRETFKNLSDVWAKEVELFLTNQDCVKILVGNKVDRDSEKAVSREEGIALAQELNSLFLECSARTRENVEQCFEELELKILEVPSLLEEGSNVGKRNILKKKPKGAKPCQPYGSCS